MSTVRVDELAQEYGMNPDELFTQLKAMGFDVVNVTSSVDRKLVDMVSDMFTGKPRERSETSKRRIVSVRKGEKVPEVEVRLEEEVLEEEIDLDAAATGEKPEPADESAAEAKVPEIPEIQPEEALSAANEEVKSTEDRPQRAPPTTLWDRRKWDDQSGRGRTRWPPSVHRNRAEAKAACSSLRGKRRAGASTTSLSMAP